MTTEEFLKDVCPNHTDKSKWNKSELLHILELHTEQLRKHAVVKSLPTDECVEQWWAEGQDQNEGFWQEAPYRTNGDVVEEIKTALKYFIETWQR